MKASVNSRYGPPTVLQIMEVEKPIPADNEVLVKVFYTTVNRTDCGFRNPEYLLVRLISGLLKPKNKILGSEFSGVIEEKGKDVQEFQLGDAVFGLRTYKFGAHAEYIPVEAKKSIVLKPINLDFNEAAAIGDGAFLAYAMLKKIDFSSRPKILINGASGSIGTACVQLASYFGAEITAVCGKKNLELMKGLGASSVLDYEVEDFTNVDRQFDFVLDVVGKSSFFKCRKILKPKGIYISSELGFFFTKYLFYIIDATIRRKKGAVSCS